MCVGVCVSGLLFATTKKRGDVFIALTVVEIPPVMMLVTFSVTRVPSRSVAKNKEQGWVDVEQGWCCSVTTESTSTPSARKGASNTSGTTAVNTAAVVAFSSHLADEVCADIRSLGVYAATELKSEWVEGRKRYHKQHAVEETTGLVQSRTRNGELSTTNQAPPPL